MSAIAIVGIGCRFPGSVHDGRSFWRLLREGRRAIREIPPGRWSLNGFYDAEPGNPFRSYSKWGGFLDDIASFDPDFFGLSRREAEAMDPQQRILLQVAYEATEDAGVPLDQLRARRTGVFIGVSNTDYGLLQRFETGVADIQAGTGTALSIVANRVSNLLDLRGPSMGLDTACSSSLVALDAACRSLRQGTADAAFAGGVNVLLDPRMFMTFCRAYMLSATGRVAAFDATADGFVRGEGAGLVLLKRLDDALAAGDRIYAVIKATAVNQDGATDSITAPSPGAQREMMRAALSEAGIDAADVAYVEAHGTGTPLGDPIEAGAIGAVFGQAPRPMPVLVGSVKCNIGHLEPAAGIAGLIKTALILSRAEVVPSINFVTPNPRIPFDALNIEVATRCAPLDDDAHALVNSFGFGGTNACAILARHAEERANVVRVRLPRPASSGGTLVPIPLSAPTPEHLAAWGRALAAALTDGELAGIALEKLGAALIRQRSQFDHRAVILARDAADLAAKLTALAEGRDWPKRDKNEPPAIVTGGGRRTGKLVFTCTGQGGQFWNMGRDFLESQFRFRHFVERFDALFAPLAGWSVMEALSASEHESTLHDPAVTPAAMFALQAGLAEVWKSVGVAPDIAIGHSFGEVTAAYLGGSIGLADVAHLVNHRGLIRGHIDRLGAMAAIGLGADALAEFLPDDGSIEIGAYNAPAMVTVSGERRSIENLIARLNAHDPNILARMLELDFAWHSSWLEPGKDIFCNAVGDHPWRAPEITVISTVTGQPETRFDTEYWWRNLRCPVRFDRAVDCALELGADTFIELGPSRTLSSPTAGCAAARGHEVLAVTTLHRGQNNYDSFHAALAGLYVAGHAIDWAALLTADDGPVALPSMPWLNQHLWKEPEEASEVLRPETAHVLLGARTSEPGWSWSSEVSLSEFPVLGDHRIMGACVLPGAAMISMLRAAAAEIFSAQAIELSEVRLPEALFIGADDRVLLRTRYDAERLRIRIFSRLRGGSEQWILRAEARIFARGTEIEMPARTSETSEVVDVGSFYRLASTYGYDFGPAFQGLRRIARGTDTLHAEAALQSKSAIDDPALDPRLLDCCLQAIIAAFDDGAAGPFLPERIDRILIGGPLGTAVRVEIESSVNAAERCGTFALTISDNTGKPCLRIQGLQAKAVEMRRPDVQAPIFLAEELMEIAPTPPSASGHWLVVSRGANGQTLTDSLIAQGLAATQTTHFTQTSKAEHIVYAVPLDLSPAVEVWPTSEEVAGAVTHLIAFGQMLVNVNDSAREVFILTRNARTGTPDPLQRALIGAARTIAIECPDIRLRLADLDDAALSQPDWPRLLLSAGNESEVLVHGRRILASYLKPQAVDDVPLRTRRADEVSGDFVLRQDRPRSLHSLSWHQSRQCAPASGEVRVRVDAAGLNFRDVMTAAGLLPKEAETGDAAAALGLEFCGTIESAGDGARLAPGTRVIGMVRGALRRYLTVAEAGVYPAPAVLTDAEAASVPSVYLTAHYALNHLARVAAGDKVLVHSGAGGLGLAAIALARRLGAEVFATAGNEEKRDYLRSLGIKHVMDSRSLDFADDVMRATRGRGVDVVLNALPGAFIDKGFGIVAPYGHFIELGKRDVYDDRAVGLKALRRNVSLHVVDAAALIDERPALTRQLMGEVLRMFTAGELAPPPVKVFLASRAADAFRYFSQARHIGKIAVDLRDPEMVVHRGRDSGFGADVDAAYLVTGGLSGFGFAIGRRLIEEGAGKVILASRSGIARPETKEALDFLRAGGAEIETLTLDVSDASQVEAAIQRLAGGRKPLRGVVHAAVAYSDAALPQMDRARIDAVLAAKVGGALNLTRAVLANGVKLDFFLSLSSLAQVIGWRGQSNYAAANAFLEGLAHLQRVRGIPGSCLNLGMLGETGVVARSDNMTSYLKSAGWLPITSDNALAATATALASAAPVLTFAVADWRRLRAGESALAASGRLDALAECGREDVGSRSLGQLDLPARKPAALSIVRIQVAAVLRIDASRIDVAQQLGDLGLDSLSSFELWNRIEAASAMAIPLARFTEAVTVDALAELLCTLAEEALPLNSEVSSSAYLIAPDRQLQEPAVTQLPRQRWTEAMRSGLMTSDYGQRALEASLAITVEAVVDERRLGTAWAGVAQRHALPSVIQNVSEVDFPDAAERLLDDPSNARLTTAPGGRVTKIALRASRALLDRWSVALLMQEMLEVLAGASAKRSAFHPWAALRCTEIQELDGPQYLMHRAFWAEMLRNAPPAVYFERRSRALAPFGFGLNRGPTVRLHAAFACDSITTESGLLAEFVQALAHNTGAGALMIACEQTGRASDAATRIVGPLATTLPLVCRLRADRSLFVRALARDLQHARQHSAFDLAACGEVFGANWRADNVVPLQFGFSFRNESIRPPTLLAAPTCHFGPLTAHRSEVGDVIANDIRLSIVCSEKTCHVELAYDADAVEPEFAKALFEAVLKGRVPLPKHSPQHEHG